MGRLCSFVQGSGRTPDTSILDLYKITPAMALGAKLVLSPLLVDWQV